MKYFFESDDAEKNTKMLPPMTHYMDYPAFYAGPHPKIENIEMGYGKLTSGLLTVAGKGRSFGVLGEGNAHYENDRHFHVVRNFFVDIDEMGVRLRKESEGRHGCDDTYIMLSIVPTVDSTPGADKVAIQVSAKEWKNSLAIPEPPAWEFVRKNAIRQKSVHGLLLVICVIALVQ